MQLIYQGRLSPLIWNPVMAGIMLLGSLVFLLARIRLIRRVLERTVSESILTDMEIPRGQYLRNLEMLAKSRRRLMLFLAAWNLVLLITALILSLIDKNAASSLPSILIWILSLMAVGASWALLYHTNTMIVTNIPGHAASLARNPNWQIRFHDVVLIAILFFFFAFYLVSLIFAAARIADPNPEDIIVLEEWNLIDLISVSIQMVLIIWMILQSFTIRRRLRNGYSPMDQGSGEIKAETSYWQRMRELMPFMWPKQNFVLQVLVVLSVSTLICGRAVNLLLPMQYKKVIDALTPSIINGSLGGLPVGPILIYVFLYFCQGTSGLVSTVQSTMWIPVEQYITRQVSVKMFRHLHDLSLRWHLNRKTGEVLRVMDRGTQAISSLLSYIWFSIVPVIIDIFIAVIYFCVQFDIYFGILVFVTMAMYLIATIYITEWRAKYRRKMIELDNQTNAKAVDSLLNFETVKYYGNEQFECKSFQDRILAYQKADWESQLSLKILNSVQNVIITLGMLTGGLLCAHRVVQREFLVGDFVLFIAYLQQLYQPLNWFGTYYRMIQQNFIDMEKMLDLFKEEAEVKDLPDARELNMKGGHVVFENVSFKYDTKNNEAPSLTNISFEIPAGKTVALVGPSGGGKSTILRLLFRFYDVQSGRILIDGQDIREVTQQSLRQAIGVVPQDTVLFNDTIQYNIRYGKVTADDKSVESAAATAQIHDKILTFAEQYRTQVGERGLRLSGGEKQRVAIARTILKDPRIILLDEATSALDTQTERQIQKEFDRMTSGRTTLIIAHRLSTIVHADVILVIKDGQILERGRHSELLACPEGLYHQLWKKQLEGKDE